MFSEYFVNLTKEIILKLFRAYYEKKVSSTQIMMGQFGGYYEKKKTREIMNREDKKSHNRSFSCLR